MSKSALLVTEKLKSARWAFDCSRWIPSHSELLSISGGIQSEEKHRINQFVFLKDAKRSLIGRLLLRKYICESTKIPWSDIVLERDQNNKPFLKNKNANEVSFNISHNGKFAVLAGECSNLNLGVDVMKMEYTGGRNISEFFRIMNRNFSVFEWSAIKGCSNNEMEQLKMFFRHWCLKESYVKATGTGVTVNLQDISFKINSIKLSCNAFIEDTELFLQGSKQANWLFQETLLDEDHCVAVAVQTNCLDMFKGELNTFCFLDFEDFLKSYKPVTADDDKFCSVFLAKEKFPEC